MGDWSANLDRSDFEALATMTKRNQFQHNNVFYSYLDGVQNLLINICQYQKLNVSVSKVSEQ